MGLSESTRGFGVTFPLCQEISNSNWPIFHLNNTKHSKSDYSLGPSPCQKSSALKDDARFPPKPSARPGLASCTFIYFLFQVLLSFCSFHSLDSPSTRIEITSLCKPSPSFLSLFALTLRFLFSKPSLSSLSLSALTLRFLFWICNSKISSEVSAVP